MQVDSFVLFHNENLYEKKEKRTTARRRRSRSGRKQLKGKVTVT